MAGCVCGHWTETVSAQPRFALDHYHETISHLQTEVPLANSWARSGPHGRECGESRSQVLFRAF